MFLSHVPSQGGMEGAVTASQALRLHNATLSWDLGLLWLPAPGSSQKMSPQRFPAEPEGGH